MPKYSVRLIVACLIVILLSTLTQNIFAAQNVGVLKQKQQKQIAKIKPSIKPSVTTAPTPTPTIAPTDTPTPIPLNNNDHIFSEINKYRQSKGLPVLSKDPYSCDFANKRAKEIKTAFNHDRTSPYPSFTEVVENIAMTGKYTDVFQLRLNSEGHRQNMERDTIYGCVGNEGNYYAFESWKPK